MIMERKDTEKASFKFGLENQVAPGLGGELRIGFVAGAEWRINSVWHNANEQPTIDNVDIVIAYNNRIRSEFWCNFADWDKFVRTTKLEYWAYVKDLLPIKEG